MEIGIMTGQQGVCGDWYYDRATRGLWRLVL